MTTLTKITLGYIGGILLGRLLPSSISSSYLWVGVGILLFVTIISFLLKQDLITTLLVLFCFLLIGFLFYGLAIEPSKGIFPFRSKGLVSITGTITRDPDIRKHKTILVLRPEKVIAQEEIPSLKGFVQISIRWPKRIFRYGERIRLSARLWTPKRPKIEGNFNYGDYLAHQQIYWLMKIDGDGEIARLGQGGANPILKLAIYLKEGISRIIKETLPYPTNLVLEGIMLGKRTDLPQNIAWWFNQVGVGHILAASGLHASFVLIISFGLFIGLMRLPLKWAMGLTIPLVILYAFITGARPSSIRASIMATSVLSFYLLDRETKIYHSLALAALIILIINPLTLLDCGFQLSFFATLGIIAFAPILGDSLKRFLPEWLAVPLAVSIAAQLSLNPLLVYYFNQISLIAIVANLVIIPLSALGVGLGFITLGLRLISFDLAQAIGLVNHFVLMGLINSAHLFSLIPYASISLPRPPISLILGYYLILIILMALIRRGKKSDF